MTLTKGGAQFHQMRIGFDLQGKRFAVYMCGDCGDEVKDLTDRLDFVLMKHAEKCCTSDPAED